MTTPRKWLYVLPNSFTVASILCGFYAMTLVSGEPTPEKFYGAALAIFFGMFLDGFDGRVARLTKTQSDFGMQLDSLADAITFGAAPSLLLWKWALSQLGLLGLFISFSFVACGALRLARFNVLEMRGGSKGASSFFVGLPIPLAAGVVVSLVIAHHNVAPGGEVPAIPVAMLALLLSFLMVSTVRYRTFKDVRFSPKSATVFGLMVATGLALTVQFGASSALVTFASLYVFVGVAEEIIFFRRRRAERLAARAAVIAGRSAVAASASVAVADASDEDEDEDELA